MPELSIMIKPASGLCNLRCKYCFYADEMSHRDVKSYGMMSEDTLEAVLRRTLAFAERQCTVAFQGGEPTLAGLDFFRKVVELEEKWNVNHVRIENALQTNGILIDEEWAAFLGKHHFLVGISLDGNRQTHDANRLDPKGKGTFARVTRTIELLKKHKVEFNVLTVVTKQLVPHIRNIYGYFARLGVDYQQYIPCLDPMEEMTGEHSYSLTSEDYARFLKDLFDCWYPEAKGGNLRYIRYFIGLMNLMAGHPSGICEMSGVCCRQFVVEADGSVYPCDFYMLDEWRLGNLVTDDFLALERKRRELRFIEMSYPRPAECDGCKWAYLCRNGCRRDRPMSPDGTPGLHRYCKAYQEFLEYAAPRLQELVRLYTGR